MEPLFGTPSQLSKQFFPMPMAHGLSITGPLGYGAFPIVDNDVHVPLDRFPFDFSVNPVYRTGTVPSPGKEFVSTTSLFNNFRDFDESAFLTRSSFEYVENWDSIFSHAGDIGLIAPPIPSPLTSTETTNAANFASFPSPMETDVNFVFSNFGVRHGRLDFLPPELDGDRLLPPDSRFNNPTSTGVMTNRPDKRSNDEMDEQDRSFAPPDTLQATSADPPKKRFHSS